MRDSSPPDESLDGIPHGSGHHPVCATSGADWHDISAVFQPTGVTSGGKEEFHSEHPHDTGSNSPYRTHGDQDVSQYCLGRCGEPTRASPETGSDPMYRCLSLPALRVSRTGCHRSSSLETLTPVPSQHTIIDPVCRAILTGMQGRHRSHKSTQIRARTCPRCSPMLFSGIISAMPTAESVARK